MKLLALVTSVFCCQWFAFAQLPGKVTVTKSKLDGAQQVQVEPAWLRETALGSDLKLGGFWSDKSKTNFVLEVVLIGVDSILGLKVGIDGQITEWMPSEKSSHHSYQPGLYNSVASIPGHSETARRFVVPLDFVERMVDGTNVVMQIQMRRGYREVTFSNDQALRARPALRKALGKVKEILNPESVKKSATKPRTETRRR